VSLFNRFERDMERREIRRELAWEENMMEMEFEEEFLFDGMFYDPFTHGDIFFDPALGHHGIFSQGRWQPMDFINGNWNFVHPRQFNVPRNYQPQNLQPAQMPGMGGGYGGGYSQNSYDQGGYAPRNAFSQQGGYAPQGAFGQPGGNPPPSAFNQQGGYAPQGAFNQPGGTPPPSVFNQPGGTPPQGAFGLPGGNPPQGAFGQQGGFGQAAPPTAGITCSRCQASHPAGTRFCPSCGNDLTPVAIPAAVSCANCNSPIEATQRFCSNCGTPRPA
jgi:hypothetical protein